MAEQQDYAESQVLEQSTTGHLPRVAFFYPEVHSTAEPLGQEQLTQLAGSGIKGLLPKIRQKYQRVLLAYLRDQQRPHQLEFMQRIFARLQNLCWDTPLSPLWEASLALVESLRPHTPENELEVTNLLQAIDLQLKAFIQQGATFVNSRPDETLFRELLFHIACSECNEHFCQTLKDRYNLTEALRLSQRNILVDNNGLSVVQALCAELEDIKEAIDLFLLSVDKDVLILQNQLPLFQQISHSLQVLGLEQEQADIRSCARELANLIEMPPSESAFESSLMIIARQLADLQVSFKGSGSVPQKESELPLPDIRKASLSLEQARTALFDYIDNQMLNECLVNAYGHLRNTQRELSFASLDSASDLVRQCADFLHEHWKVEQGYHPEKSELENLSDFVASLEYYLDRHADQDPSEPETILEVAAEGLKALTALPEIVEPVAMAYAKDEEFEFPVFSAEELTLVEIDEPVTVAPETPEEQQLLENETPSNALSAFLEEAPRIQQQLKQQLAEWLPDQTPEIHLTDIRRAFHTLKGISREVGANIIGELAWSLENMFNHTLDGTARPGRDMRQLVIRAVDMLPGLIHDVEQDSQLLTPDVLVCMEMADALARGEHYNAPEHPDDLSEEEDDEVAVQFGEVVSDPVPAGTLSVGVSVEELSDYQLSEVFRTEAQGYLNSVVSFVGQAENSDPAITISDNVKQALHALKGICRVSGYSNLAELVTVWEDVTQYVYHHKLPVSEPVARMLREGCLLVADAISQLEEQPEELLLDTEGFLDWLANLRDELTESPTALVSDAATYQLLSAEYLYIGNASSYLPPWQKQINTDELTYFLRELTTLAEYSREAGYQDIVELSNALLDICHYLDNHQEKLPELLTEPMNDGFNALMDMLDQVAAQQTLTPPAGLFTQLRESLEVLQIAEFAAEETTLSPEGFELELLELFLEEARDLNEACHKSLEQWLKNSSDITFVEELQRVLHTLKGGACMVDQLELSDLSHALEDVYQKIIVQKPAPEQIPLGLLQASHDHIDKMLLRLLNQHQVPAPESLVRKLREWQALELPRSPAFKEKPIIEPMTILPDYLAANPEQSEGERLAASDMTIKVGCQEALTTRITSPVSRQLERAVDTIRIPAPILQQQINLAAESDNQRLVIEQQTHHVAESLKKLGQDIQLVTRQLQQLRQIADTLILEKTSDSEHYATLRNLSNTLIKSTRDLQQLRSSTQRQNDRVLNELTQLSSVQSELHDQLLRAQLVPFASVIPRLEKITRQAASELDKPVTLTIDNEHTLIDRGLLERTLAPLEHLIRNAVSHGIEPKEQRKQKGKPKTGQLTLRLHHSDNQVVMELHDDGRGIDSEVIRQHALGHQIIRPDEELSEEELVQLILEPGFSTAAAIDQISGRGVGLDVVNTEVRQLGGQLSIHNSKGAGTCFVLELPFMLAVTHALVVETEAGVYAMPLSTLDAVVVRPSEEIRNPGQQPVEHYGRHYPLLFLNSLLHQSEPTIPDGDCPLVLIRHGQQPFALVVDKLLGHQELVIRNLGAQFTHLQGVSGGSLLKDGRVVIIVDPQVLIRRCLTDRYYSELQSQALPQKSCRVLIADDSATVRKVTSHLLRERGFEVDSVCDGAEAIVQLAGNKPDVLLLDIEMPKMDGFEVASAIRKDDSLKDLPIILVSSEANRDYQTRAKSLGITEYYGKPFQESHLLEAIQRLTGEA